MKNIIKKISVIMIALMLMFGAVVSTNVKSIYADDNIITIKFTYVRSDNKYSDYYMKAFTSSTSVDTDGEFMIVDDKAVFECKFQKNIDIDEIISFRVMEKTINEAVISGNVDIATINSGVIEVTINGDSGKTTVVGSNSSAESEFTGNTNSEENTTSGENTSSEENTTSEVESTETVQPEISYTEELDVGDDPNKDYSMKPAMVIVVDVLFLAGLGACVFLVLNKKKNAFM